MKILIALRELVNPGGAELVAAETAKELAARGHDVSVYACATGDFATTLLPSSVRPVTELSAVPWKPDIIHGQHHLPAMAASARFDTTPAVYHCHGTFPWVDQPPMHPNIRRYIMMCQWMVKRFETESAIEPGRTVCIPNFVNTVRFSEVRQPPERIKKAVLFNGHGHSTDELRRLKRACAAHGISLDMIGSAYGNIKYRPEVFLQSYDLVFALGKSALEAMATGCAVMTLVPGQAGGLITPDTFDEAAYSNFSPRYFMSATQIGPEWLLRELSRYTPAQAAEVTRRARQERRIDLAIDQFENQYRAAVEAGPGESTAAFAPYLEYLAREVDRMCMEYEGLRRQVRCESVGRRLLWRFERACTLLWRRIWK